MDIFLENLKNRLLENGLPLDQVTNIMNNIDLSKINLNDMGATQEYLSGILAGFNLDQGILNDILNGFLSDFNLGDHFGGGIADHIKSFLGDIFGG